MKIDEAIKHCLEVADDKQNCLVCRTEHKQLAIWLQELKQRKEKEKADVIKPCPFCGGESVLCAVDTHAHRSYRVQCLDCQTSTPLYEKSEPAINGWNKRADSNSRDVPKLPHLISIKTLSGEEYEEYHCGECGADIGSKFDNFCSECGQAFDWGEYEQ